MNDLTNVQYQGKTNNEGIYVVTNLPPGPYRIQVSKPGFKTLIKPDLILNVQDALAISFTLPLGSVGFERHPADDGQRLVWLERSVVNRLRALRGPGESYSDVILRLVEIEARGR